MPYKIQKKDGKHCVVKEGGAQVACHDTPGDAKAQLRALYANEKADLAHALATGTGTVPASIPCFDPECDRAFLEVDRMFDHAESVHTFSDIEELVRDAVRDKYNVDGDYRATPPIPSVYAYVRDLSTDWVVFQKNDHSPGGKSKDTLYKASYSITDGKVTLGEPTEVVRKTVYEPVKKTEA